jgi:ribonucleoside-diphosphate reductase subunit M2
MPTYKNESESNVDYHQESDSFQLTILQKENKLLKTRIAELEREQQNSSVHSSSSSKSESSLISLSTECSNDSASRELESEPIQTITSGQIKDPLLNPESDAYVMFPIQYNNLWSLYVKSFENFWQPNEINFDDDLHDWNLKLNDQERDFVSNILAFFAASDGIVMENLAMRFYGDVHVSEAKAFYAIQIAIETIHSHTYSLMIDTYIRDEKRKNDLLNAVDTIPCVGKKAEWCKKWIHDDSPFHDRVVAFACVEGIFFSGSFCSIFWLKHRGFMPGLCTANALISKDEALHCDFAVALHHSMLEKCSEETARLIVQDAVEIEREFICDALPCKLIGIHSGMMYEYIQYVANRLMAQLGFRKIYADAKNPFPWMEMISMKTQTNMFESVVTNYGMANVQGDAFSGLEGFDIGDESP